MARRNDRRVCVAKVGAPHGVRGAVRLKIFTDDPLAAGAYGPLQVEDEGRTLTVSSLRPAKGVVVAVFEGIGDRDEAEALKNKRLYVARAVLPETGDDDEFYQHDLIGLAAVTPDGARLGEVVAVQDFGSGDLVELRPETGPTFYVPFTREIVPEVDIAGGRIVVDLPPGLIGEEAT